MSRYNTFLGNFIVTKYYFKKMCSFLKQSFKDELNIIKILDVSVKNTERSIMKFYKYGVI